MKLFRASLLIGLLLTGISVFAQNNAGIGVIGPLRGRITNTSGSGVGGAVISVVPVSTCFDWEGTFAKSSSNGSYFVQVHYDCALLVTASKNGMTFAPGSMFVSIDGNYENVDFVGTRILLKENVRMPE